METVQPLRYESSIGSNNLRRSANGLHVNIFQPSYAPENTFAGHLEFMLKYERIHLEFLSRLFEVAGEKELTEWVRSAPHAKNARRAAWMFEWLSQRSLDVGSTVHSGYVDVLEPEKYWTATKRTNDRKFGVRNNFPGTPDLCPMVMLEDEVLQATDTAKICASIKALEAKFGVDLLRRASAWLTIKESRSSFGIEGEGDPAREDRFASAMESMLGQLDDMFGADLPELQRQVLGPQTLHIGLRRSPMFVGQIVHWKEVVHYVAPNFLDVSQLLKGLSDTLMRTSGSHPLIRAAALSFAFVYVHPLCDGNGRISRFVINDVLMREGVIDHPLIIPVSATILKDMASYDRILETFSRPLMRRYREFVRFGAETKFADGEISNFEFNAYKDALHAWRFPELTSHALYLGGVVQETLKTEMVEEAEFLRRHYLMRSKLSQIIQLSDNALDRIIRSITQNKRITGVLQAEYPILEDTDLGNRVLESVISANDGEPA